MDIQQVHPELRKAYSRMPALPIHNPAFHFVFNLLMKLMPARIKPAAGVDIEDRSVGKCTVRIFRPEGKASGAGLLWIHGGGYIMGNAGMNDRECTALARELKLVVVYVDYRLAPRHPFPAALDDCFDAWNFMQTSAGGLGIDRERIAVLGQSAGGGLAAGLVQRLADTGGVQPATQLLMYPMIDDRTAANRELDQIKHFFWNNKNNRGAWGWYLGQPPGLDEVPAYSVPARREDLSGLPPTWMCVGEVDLFYKEDCAYAERLKAAGVPCELHISPQTPHAYDFIAPESSLTKATMHDCYRFLREQLHV
jgi:acetyl esterase/lipase